MTRNKAEATERAAGMRLGFGGPGAGGDASPEVYPAFRLSRFRHFDHPAPMIYLDHNATTPMAPEVREAMLAYLTEE